MLIVLYLVLLITSSGFQANENLDYMEYHKQIIEAEKLLGEEQFADALVRYEQIFTLYDFVFCGIIRWLHSYRFT